jgi:hypothetical protein
MQSGLITYLIKAKATAIRSEKQTWYAICQDKADATKENMTPASSYVLKKWVESPPSWVGLVEILITVVYQESKYQSYLLIILSQCWQPNADQAKW